MIRYDMIWTEILHGRRRICLIESNKILTHAQPPRGLKISEPRIIQD